MRGIGLIALSGAALSALACGGESEGLGPEEVRELRVSTFACGPVLEIPVGQTARVELEPVSSNGTFIPVSPIEVIVSPPRVAVELLPFDEDFDMTLSYDALGIEEGEADVTFTHRRSGASTTLHVRVVPAGTFIEPCPLL